MYEISPAHQKLTHSPFIFHAQTHMYSLSLFGQALICFTFFYSYSLKLDRIGSKSKALKIREEYVNYCMNCLIRSAETMGTNENDRLRVYRCLTLLRVSLSSLSYFFSSSLNPPSFVFLSRMPNSNKRGVSSQPF
jgi:hypothetical protein